MTASEVLRQHWDGSLPVPLVSIAQRLGIRVFKDDQLEVCSRISKSGNEGLKIVFNPTEPMPRQRFCIAHAIGHFALEHLDRQEVFEDGTANFSLSVKDRKEQEANQFAMRLLMPKGALTHEFRKIFGSRTLEEMAERFGVSTVALRQRLIETGLISKQLA